MDTFYACYLKDQTWVTQLMLISHGVYLLNRSLVLILRNVQVD